MGNNSKVRYLHTLIVIGIITIIIKYYLFKRRCLPLEFVYFISIKSINSQQQVVNGMVWIPYTV